MFRRSSHAPQVLQLVRALAKSTALDVGQGGPGTRPEETCHSTGAQAPRFCKLQGFLSHICHLQDFCEEAKIVMFPQDDWH